VTDAYDVEEVDETAPAEGGVEGRVGNSLGGDDGRVQAEGWNGSAGCVFTGSIGPHGK
jgi:hypothetical protein